MGLGTVNLTRILQIIKLKGGSGKTLCMIGKQDIHISWDSLREIIHKYHFNYDKRVYEAIKDIQPIDSFKLFEMFRISGGVHAVDFSEYENADIIFDLNEDLPEELFEKFDYVINSGTLEHVFDVAKAMRNISDMVRPGGVIVHIVPFGGLANHGFYSFSPTFFQDYYETNGFDILDLNMEFLLENSDVIFSQDCRAFEDDYRIINEYVKKTMQINEVECILLLCVAQKSDSKDASYPLQGMYKKIYSACIEKNDIRFEDVFELLRGNSNKKIALYGAGNISGLVINELYKIGMENMIAYILDSNVLKSGTCYRGYQTFYPSKSRVDKTDMIIICTTKYEDEIYKFLLKEGAESKKIYRITNYMK